jgi:hypothetical protein
MVRLAKDSRAQARKVKGQDFLLGAYLGNARGLMQAARIIKGYDSMAILFWERSKEVA